MPDPVLNRRQRVACFAVFGVTGELTGERVVCPAQVAGAPGGDSDEEIDAVALGIHGALALELGECMGRIAFGKRDAPEQPMVLGYAGRTLEGAYVPPPEEHP